MIINEMHPRDSTILKVIFCDYHTNIVYFIIKLRLYFNTRLLLDSFHACDQKLY